jgi:hypothetical protein
VLTRAPSNGDVELIDPSARDYIGNVDVNEDNNSRVDI